MSQLNLFSGRALRDNGTQQTLANEHKEWLALAMPMLVKFARTKPHGFLAEEFRLWWCAPYQGREEGQTPLPMPHSEKCWGALFLVVARTGVIRRTGEYRQATSMKNHAHRYAVWEHTPVVDTGAKVPVVSVSSVGA